MPDNSTGETRELEMKMAWLENQVSELDAVVRGLGDELLTLRREVAELRAAAVRRSEGEPADDEGSLNYEKPPHY
ncbi:MAG: SlyX family protein [Pseudomonadota bacterium]|nr:SlyX family protein [Pseudomonadota bacterium]